MPSAATCAPSMRAGARELAARALARRTRDRRALPWWQYGKPKCWPACGDAVELVGRQVVAEHVAAVVGEPERASSPGSQSKPTLLRTPRATVSRPLPSAIHALDDAVAVARLADVARRADRDVELAVGTEGDELPAVVAFAGKPVVRRPPAPAAAPGGRRWRRSAGSSRPRRRRGCRRARRPPRASRGRWRRVRTGPARPPLDLERVDLAGAAAADVDDALAVGAAAERHLPRVRHARRSAARSESPRAGASLSSCTAACAGTAPPCDRARARAARRHRAVRRARR